MSRYILRVAELLMELLTGSAKEIWTKRKIQEEMELRLDRFQLLSAVPLSSF
jgi:hypothetical protein